MQFAFSLPKWIDPFLEGRPRSFTTDDAKMELAVALAVENIKQHTGGPFGAAVFDQDGGLVAVGVNLVTTANSSILHAEMIAIAMAEQKLGRYDLSDGGEKSFTLAASTEPCAMCFGAIPWSGIKRLLCGARDGDARAIGFDEGPKLPDWVGALNERGIEVRRGLLYAQAVNVLNRYAAQGGEIYNAGQGR